jgi:linoleate 10R-lipoxygenase
MSPDVQSKGESAANGAQNGFHTTNGSQANSSNVNGHHPQDKIDPKKMTQLRQADRLQKKKGSSIGALMQLRKASKRPLPTEMGDGTYRSILMRPSLVQDLRSMGKGGEYIQSSNRT